MPFTWCDSRSGCAWCERHVRGYRALAIWKTHGSCPRDDLTKVGDFERMLQMKRKTKRRREEWKSMDATVPAAQSIFSRARTPAAREGDPRRARLHRG